MVKRFLLSLLLLASSVWAQAQNVPPTVSMFTSSVIGIAGTTITLNANASDQDGQIAKVDFYNGTTLLGTVTQKQPPCTTYCFAWPNVQAGVYNLTAVATDNLGASTTSAAFTTMVFAPPTVAIATPANNASYAAPASITFTANAADADGRVTKVEYLNGTTVIDTATAAPYSVTWSNVAVGSYVITARATDNTGIKTTSATVNVTVSANQAPTVTLEANPASTPAPGNVMLSANATDSDGTIAKVEFYNGTTLLSTLTQPPFAYNWLNIPAGTYTVTAKATDNGGMETVSTAVTVTVAAGPAQAYYIHADHVNTPRLITDQAGNKVWEWDNADPFGANAANEDPGNTGTRFTFNPRFPGQYFDRETGLHYNYFRDYDPATGRYVESDPIGLQGGLNTYGYVNGNPLSLIDPRGHAALGQAIGGAIGGALGGALGIEAGPLAIATSLAGRAVGAAIGSKIEDMCTNNDQPEHRGRIQAQSRTYEDSESWARNTPLKYIEGVMMLESLVARMPKREYEARNIAVEEARVYMYRVSLQGGTGPTSRTFQNPGKITERIDIEVRKGLAFVP